MGLLSFPRVNQTTSVYSGNNRITPTLKTAASVYISFFTDSLHRIARFQIGVERKKTQMWRISDKKAEWVSRLDSLPRSEIKWLFSGESNLHRRRERAHLSAAPRWLPGTRRLCSGPRQHVIHYQLAYSTAFILLSGRT